MTPDRKYYKTTELMKPAWADVFAEKVYGRVCFECMIFTRDKKRITAFLAPSESVLGEGEIIIPLKVPRKERKGRNKHTLADVAGNNQATFGNENHLPIILESFGLTSKHGKKRKSGEFQFSIESSIKGEWTIIIDRKINNIPKWRLDGAAIGIESAMGLGQSFQDQTGCVVTPPDKD